MPISEEIYITIDIDWASDEALDYTMRCLEDSGVSATFFATHYTRKLDAIRNNKRFELGIHPNFNNLLNGMATFKEKNIRMIVQKGLDMVPEARSVRSHSLVGGSIFRKLFSDMGLRYDCNPFIPATSGIALQPWLFRNGMVVVPFMWSDYMHCSYEWEWDADKFLMRDGLKVFAFHPVHIALNTSDIAIYRKNKQALSDFRYVSKLRCHDLSRGVDVFLRNLISRAAEHGYSTKKISDIPESGLVNP